MACNLAHGLNETAPYSIGREQKISIHKIIYHYNTVTQLGKFSPAREEF